MKLKKLKNLKGNRPAFCLFLKKLYFVWLIGIIIISLKYAIIHACFSFKNKEISEQNEKMIVRLKLYFLNLPAGVVKIFDF